MPIALVRRGGIFPGPYRKDTQRSAFQDAAPKGTLTVKWSVKAGEVLSPPVIANQKVFVVSKNAHTIRCLDVTNGKLLWSYVADGRVDSAPSYYRGQSPVPAPVSLSSLPDTGPRVTASAADGLRSFGTVRLSVTIPLSLAVA